jgi:hypothetical protein
VAGSGFQSRKMYVNAQVVNLRIGMFPKRNRIMTIKRLDLTGKKFGRYLVIGRMVVVNLVDVIIENI